MRGSSFCLYTARCGPVRREFRLADARGTDEVVQSQEVVCLCTTERQAQARLGACLLTADWSLALRVIRSQGWTESSGR